MLYRNTYSSLSPHFDRWLPRASRGCKTVWIEFQKKKKKKKEETYAHTHTQPINRMTLAQLSLNYIAAIVSSISIRPSFMPLHFSSISHPSSPLSFTLLTIIHFSPIPGLSWMYLEYVRVYLCVLFCMSVILCIHMCSYGCLSQGKTRVWNLKKKEAIFSTDKLKLQELRLFSGKEFQMHVAEQRPQSCNSPCHISAWLHLHNHTVKGSISEHIGYMGGKYTWEKEAQVRHTGCTGDWGLHANVLLS